MQLSMKCEVKYVDAFLELEATQWLTVLVARVASRQRQWCGMAQGKCI